MRSMSLLPKTLVMWPRISVPQRIGIYPRIAPFDGVERSGWLFHGCADDGAVDLPVGGVSVP